MEEGGEVVRDCFFTWVDILKMKENEEAKKEKRKINSDERHEK